MSAETILIVEDEAIIALEEALVLRKAGFKVLQAANGPAALNIVRAKKGQLDLILMDINLGAGPDGTQVAQEILRDYDIPVLFCSSHTEDEMVARTEKITSYGYVVKMSGPTVLIASVKMAFKLHSAYRTLKEKQLAIDRRDAVLGTVNSIAGLCLRTAACMDCMNEALAQLGRAADVSRCYIFANHADAQGRLVADQRFEWCAPGASAQINNPDLQSMSYSDDLVRVADTLKSGRDFFCNAADLSPIERRLIDPQEVVSLLLVPIIVRGAWWGFIGFDECRRPREWDLTEREALRVAAGILGAAIEQREAMQAFYSNELAFRSVFSTVVEGFSQTTPDGRYLKANPALAKLLGYDSPEQLMAGVNDIGRQLYVRPEDRERYKRILEEKGFINGFEADFHRRDGSTVRVSIDAGAVRDASGRVEYYFSSNREIASCASTSRSV